jgi:hypothetical protein
MDPSVRRAERRRLAMSCVETGRDDDHEDDGAEIHSWMHLDEPSYWIATTV